MWPNGGDVSQSLLSILGYCMDLATELSLDLGKQTESACDAFQSSV